MEREHYIGLDIHKKIIAYCIKTKSGKRIGQGKISATRKGLNDWIKKLPQPWTAAMEATLFTAWIYDFLKPHAYKLMVAHPEMLKAITAAKKKNDRDDAEKITDLLRVDMLPECYMAPRKLRELRRILRYRNYIVRTAVKEKNKYRDYSWRLELHTQKDDCMERSTLMSYWETSKILTNRLSPCLG